MCEINSPVFIVPSKKEKDKNYQIWLKEYKNKILSNGKLIKWPDNKYCFQGDIAIYCLKIKSIRDLNLNIFQIAGSITYRNLNIESLDGCPNIIEDCFYCNNNQLTTLEGGPKKVYGHIFNCSHNQLKNLTYFPVGFEGIFICSHNEIISLKNGPSKNITSYYCYTNKLTSLEYSPDIISVDFNCAFNQLINLDYAPQLVGEFFNCSHNQITTLKGCPEIVGGSFDCSYNQLESLEYAPKEVGGTFNCAHNKVKFTSEQVQSVCRVRGTIFT